MIVFLRSISAQATQSDIIAFIEPALKVSLFSKKGVIEHVKILHLKDLRTNISEFHGLVTIEPDAVALKVIKRLNRKKFLNKYIAVREYHRRDWHNDPRSDHKPASGVGKAERRVSDRRRRNLIEVEGVKESYSSNKKFHRRY